MNNWLDDGLKLNFILGDLAAILGANALDVTGLYREAIRNPDPVATAGAAAGGLFANTAFGAMTGWLFGGFQYVGRTMAGAGLAAAVGLGSESLNTGLRALDETEKYVRDNHESYLVQKGLELKQLTEEKVGSVYEEAKNAVEEIYGEVTGPEEYNTYSPTVSELAEVFAELEAHGEVKKFRYRLESAVDWAELPELIRKMETDEGIKIRDEDIRIEEKIDGGKAIYEGVVEYALEIDSETYRPEKPALEFKVEIRDDQGIEVEKLSEDLKEPESEREVA